MDFNTIGDTMARLLTSARARRVLLFGSALGVFATLTGAFLVAPREAVEGEVQRVFYIHVPMAWVAYAAFAVVFAGSAMYLWKRQPAWDILARSSAEVGLLFTSLVLVTGSLWGKPIWGTWWVWDARLTTTLILWCLYAGYLTIRAFAGSEEQGARFSAVVGIIAFIDVPIVHMSVTWWRTLHPQPIVIRPLESPALPNSMLAVLMGGFVAFTLLFLAMLSYRFSIGMLEDRLRATRRQRILREAGIRRAAVRRGPTIREAGQNG